MSGAGGEHQFDRVQILKDEDSELGVGSYGAVYKAKCDDLLCAAKVLHRALFQTNDPGARDVLSRFQQIPAGVQILKPNSSPSHRTVSWYVEGS